MKLNVPEIPKGIPSEKEPCPIGYTKNTAEAAATGASKRKKVNGVWFVLKRR
jgi:hypothetical protein